MAITLFYSLVFFSFFLIRTVPESSFFFFLIYTYHFFSFEFSFPFFSDDDYLCIHVYMHSYSYFLCGPITVDELFIWVLNGRIKMI